MSGLTPKQRRAVQALCEFGSITEAAQACHLSRRTLHRWMLNPDFAQALTQASAGVLEQASLSLTAGTSEAVAVLRELLTNESPHQRRLAAEAIVTNALRLRELTQFEQRISALEQRYGK